jgi:hypothetical protein
MPCALAVVTFRLFSLRYPCISTPPFKMTEMSSERSATGTIGAYYLNDPPPLGQSAPYGPMAKPYHPSYTNLNPAAKARGYTSETVCCRKVTFTYDWLPSDREVKNWFRRVPYRLEKGKANGSWVVRYFEFRAGIGPLPGVGFIGDLWISWNSRDPSIWFKVEEGRWEKWGGCASSVREVSLFFFFRGILENIITHIITHLSIIDPKLIIHRRLLYVSRIPDTHYSMSFFLFAGKNLCSR